MKYRDFGTTGLKVSQLVFGGGAVGGLLINQDDETKLTAIRRAIQAGINWIDTVYNLSFQNYIIPTARSNIRNSKDTLTKETLYPPIFFNGEKCVIGDN